MADRTRKLSGMTVGIDVGDKLSQFCILDGDGEVIETGSVRTTQKGMATRFRGLEPTRLALEVGTHSPWMSQALEEWGHEVLVANPRRFRLIARSDSKDDRTDAEILARVARMDPGMLRPIRHRHPEARRDLTILRSRDELVRCRTALVNHVRGIVKPFAVRLPKCSTRYFPEKVEDHIPANLLPLLKPVLEMIQFINKQIRKYDKTIERLAEDKYPEVLHLTEVCGVGPLTALAYVLTLEDPGRFPQSRKVGSYLGLRPRQRDSGEQRPQLRITKAGDAFLRRLLIGSGHHILGPFGSDSDLRRWGLALAERGGKNAKKRAAVAVARKLAVLLHRLWVTGEVYEPLRNSLARAQKQKATA